MRFIRSLVVATLFLSVSPALAEEPAKQPEKAKPENAKAAEKCHQHGVKKTLCTRCNPKLEAVFKAKGDWCGEHKRPESQCAICKPELEKQGVKP